jgi:TatD DNase family protein
MIAPYVDSHCHLAMLEGAEDALARARKAGIRGVLVPGTRLDDAGAAVAIGEAHPDVWAAVGFHPHDAKDFDDVAEATIDSFLEREKVVAVGEIGLDYHYDHSPREVQRDVLVRQLALASRHELPAIIHNRESTDDLVAILSGGDALGVCGVLHSFTESYEVASHLIDLGWYVSFSGILTFRNAEALRDVAKKLPPDRVLIETDTPYLAPVPHRGRRNEPAFVVHVAETLAQLWRLPLDEVAETTTRNFEDLFGVSVTT